MNLARNYITEFSVNGNFSEFTVCGPAPFFRSDIFANKSGNTEIAELQEWILTLIDKLGGNMQYLLEAPECALLEFAHKTRTDRDLGPQIILIVEIEKEGERQHYWWVAVPTSIFERFTGDVETFDRKIAKPLAYYVCEVIREKVKSLDVKKCTAFVASAQQTPKTLNMPEFFTEVIFDPSLNLGL